MSENEKVELDEQTLQAVKELAKIRELEKAQALRKDELSEIIKVALGEAVIGTSKGLEICSIASRSRTSVDTKALSEKHPKLFERFSKSSSYTFIDIKKSATAKFAE